MWYQHCLELDVSAEAHAFNEMRNELLVRVCSQPMVENVELEVGLQGKCQIERDGARRSLESEVPDDSTRPRQEGSLPNGNGVRT